MFRRSVRFLLFFLLFAMANQGCSSDSDSPVGPGDGEDDGWSTQLVKSGNFANGEINVSIDASDKLYVSAYESSVGLQYITNKSGSWISTLVAEENEDRTGVQNDIAVDNNGKVHTVYSHDGGIGYATDESGTWSNQDMWLGSLGSCCIVSDGGGNLHSAFDDGSNWDIRYTYKPVGGAWGTPVAIDDQWINSACDIDVDGSDNPHVIYNFAGHYNLRYAFRGGSWSVTTIEGSDSYPYEPDTGWTPAIAVNKSTDEVNIVFWNRTESSVWFSNGVAQSAVKLKDTADWARPCLALDSEGYAHVFFGEGGTNAINYATNKSGAWVNTVLSIEIGGNNELAVTIDAGDKIHVIYSRSGGQELRHASIQL